MRNPISYAMSKTISSVRKKCQKRIVVTEEELMKSFIDSDAAYEFRRQIRIGNEIVADLNRVQIALDNGSLDEAIKLMERTGQKAIYQPTS